MKINWLTKEYIAEQGKKSKKAAVLCSRDHWKQLWQATKKQLRKARKHNQAGVGGPFCALCFHFEGLGGCSNCLFYNRNCGGGLWGNAVGALDNWEEGTGPFLAWKKAAKAVYLALNELAKKYES